jgi:hypothetical protein
MKWITSGLCAFLLLAALACSKGGDTSQEEVGKKFPDPQWKEDTTGKYGASMTSVVVLPATLILNLLQNDQLAAFINDECRGVGTLEKVNNVDLYFIMIHGKPDETSSVKFKYYSSKTSFLYESTTPINFLIDAVYGTAQNPKTLELAQVK